MKSLEPPRHLVELAEALESADIDWFADFELRVVEDPGGPLLAHDPDSLCSLLGTGSPETAETFPPVLGIFARDGSGGLLALVMEGATSAEQALVVWLTSEGQVDVLGENFDDFLALLSGDWSNEAFEHLAGSETLRDIAIQMGITPHEHPEARLEALSAHACDVVRMLRRVEQSVFERDRPPETNRFELVIGERLGPIALGERLEQLEARLGPTAELPWLAALGDTTRSVSGLPFFIDVDSENRIEAITASAGKHSVHVNGFELMLTPWREAEAWMATNDPSFQIHATGGVAPRELTSRALGLTLTIHSPMSVLPHGWVKGLIVRAPQRSV